MNFEIGYVGGHSFDCIYIYLPDYTFLLAGENIAIGRGKMRSVPHISPFGNPYDYMNALRRIHSIPAATILPSHGQFLETQQAQAVIRENLTYLDKMEIACEIARTKILDADRLLESCPEFESTVCGPCDEYLPIARTFHKENWKHFLLAPKKQITLGVK